jgi:uncharacterized Fe-S cluster-containing radical SAM superfamily enzyme
MTGKTKSVEIALDETGQPKDPDGLINLLLNATEIKGTAVVKTKDGSIRYNDPAKAGQFNEEVLNDSIDPPPE